MPWHCPGLTEWGPRAAAKLEGPGQRTRPDSDGGADGPGRGRLGSLAWPEGVCGGTRLPLKSLEVSEKTTAHATRSVQLSASVVDSEAFRHGLPSVPKGAAGANVAKGP